MAAIRRGVEQLPPGVGRPVDPATRYRCGWCPYAGTRDDVDAHEDATHPEALAPMVTR